MKEHKFIETINIIAESHNCKCVNIDPINRQINIEGSENNQTSCAMAISEFMSQCGDIEELEMPQKIKQLSDKIGWAI